MEKNSTRLWVVSVSLRRVFSSNVARWWGFMHPPVIYAGATQAADVAGSHAAEWGSRLTTCWSKPEWTPNIQIIHLMWLIINMWWDVIEISESCHYESNVYTFTYIIVYIITYECVFFYPFYAFHTHTHLSVFFVIFGFVMLVVTFTACIGLQYRSASNRPTPFQSDRVTVIKIKVEVLSHLCRHRSNRLPTWSILLRIWKSFRGKKGIEHCGSLWFSCFKLPIMFLIIYIYIDMGNLMFLCSTFPQVASSVQTHFHKLKKCLCLQAV